MSDYQASSLYLACLSSSVKKRSTRQLKSVQEELDVLANTHSPTTLIHREGARDVPYAWEAFKDDLLYQQVQIIYFFSDTEEGEKLYLSSKSSKRLELDLEEFSWKSFPDLKLLILDGKYSLDTAEKFLFSGAPAVLLLPESVKQSDFRRVFFAHLLKGERLRTAIQELLHSFGIQLPFYSIPSDPYDYWEWKEKRLNENNEKGCLLSLDGNEDFLLWTWTPFAFLEEEEEVHEDFSEPEQAEKEEDEEPKEWFELENTFTTWNSQKSDLGYREVREREYQHIAAKSGDESPDPIWTSKEYELPVSTLVGFETESTSSYELVKLGSSDEMESLQVGTKPQQDPQVERQGRRMADAQPQAAASSSVFSWPVMTWATLALTLITLSSLAYMMPGRQTPRLSDFQFLSSFSSEENYNVLLLPFTPQSAQVDGIAWAERTVRDWVNTLKESEDLGIRVIYARGSELPHTTEEAKRIGEIYDANLVIWGDYGVISRDTNIHHLRYVSPNSIYTKADLSEVSPGAAAFNDVYDLQEGFLTGGIEDINYWILATAYLKKGDYQSAYSNLQLVQNNEGRGMAVIHQMIAKCYFGLEYFNDCIQSYTTAIQLDPGNANAYFQRANVYQLTDHKEKAISDYQMALKVNPNHLEAKAKLEALTNEMEKIEVTVPKMDNSNNSSFTLLEAQGNFVGNQKSK